jgi:hypothetical protein
LTIRETLAAPIDARYHVAHAAVAAQSREEDMSRLALAVLIATLAVPAFARQPKTYQVTGEVKEVTPDLIVVQKGKENFEIARTADTKVTGDLKVGGKATVEYRMTAATAEAKAEKAKGAKK